MPTRDLLTPLGPDDPLREFVCRVEEHHARNTRLSDPETYARRIIELAEQAGGQSLPAPTDDEGIRRDIQHALGELWKFYWQPDQWDFLPDNKTLVDDICRDLAWFGVLEPRDQIRVFEIAAEEIDAYRRHGYLTTARQHADTQTRSAAEKQARRLEKINECLDQMQKIDSHLWKIHKLASGAGRTAAVIAPALEQEQSRIERDIALAAAQFDLLLNAAT